MPIVFPTLSNTDVCIRDTLSSGELPNTMVPALPDNVLRHIFSYLTLPKAADLIDTIEDRFGDHVNGHLRELRIQRLNRRFST